MFITKPTRFLLKNLIKASAFKLKKGPHITRYYMYQHLASVLMPRITKGKILSISHSTNLCRQFFDLTQSELQEANYPDCNFVNLPFDDNEFDYVVSDQVLEHIEGNPQQAIDESWRVLKPGGLAIHTTCFINPIHEYPGDFWRFTPQALTFLCGEFSNIIEVGGWGNRYVWVMDAVGLRYQAIPEASWHPLNKIAQYNDKKWPVVTWIIAEK
ncbi:methyltransferase domain-containing protein [Spirulina subsalsa FACHB-351]|uniref:Methyltransferase domain-containing protein n=1 Tax=Spirulina subsalsa FACHB-351 TaxID=234711 RepID=A0ABT3L785_9CYAN|nr:methyltransferase domain-containing protein [Spirulina subsalsa]MCW6037047.1 methyltransferase domain-containing protein [Spirulina subsalsa FACHB-351]